MTNEKIVKYTIYPEHRNRHVIDISESNINTLFPDIEKKKSIKGKGKLFEFDKHFGKYNDFSIKKVEDRYLVTVDGKTKNIPGYADSMDIVKSTFPEANRITVDRSYTGLNKHRGDYTVVFDSK